VQIFVRTLSGQVVNIVNFGVMKRPRIEVRATPELLEKLRHLAEKSKRSESEYLRLLIELAFEHNLLV
jgi:hypothetical protein